MIIRDNDSTGESKHRYIEPAAAETLMLRCSHSVCFPQHVSRTLVRLSGREDTASVGDARSQFGCHEAPSRAWGGCERRRLGVKTLNNIHVLH